MKEKSKLKINWKYALGEYFIVVLGIITALQLDSCRENQKNDNLEIEYLSDLSVGLERDSIFYENALAYFKDIQNSIDSTANFINQRNFTLNPSSQRALKQYTDWYSAYISNSVFEELNNSGRLNLIKDKTLRYNIISYYQYIDFIKSQDNEINFDLGRMNEYLLKHIHFKENEFEIDDEHLSTIINFIKAKKSYIEGYLGHRKTINQINSELRKQIENILNP